MDTSNAVLDDDAGVRQRSARRDSLLDPSDYILPLADCSREIRICSIQPGPLDSPLEVFLQAINLEESQGQYNCLSYAWGPTSNERHIILNGRKHVISRNLHLHLSRLRTLGLGQRLWVDALSINQANSRECSTQVARMGSIFGGARETYLCVDEASPHLQLFDEVVSDAFLTAMESLAAGCHPSKLTCYAPGNEEVAGRTVNDILRYLCRASYWSRCWIVQEIVLSRHATMFGGFGTIPWRTIVQALRQWEYHRHRCCFSFVESLPKDIQKAYYQLLTTISLIVHIANLPPQERHLINVLQAFAHKQASRRRDKLYAFFGLASGDLPEPDYHSSVEQVLTSMTEWLLQNTENLQLLAMDLPRNKPEGIPSWVPDFSSNPPFDDNYWRRRFHCLQTYDCARGLPRLIRFPGRGELRSGGVQADVIDQIAPHTITLSAMAKHPAIMREWQKFAPCSVVAGDVFTDEFCSTMLAGCVDQKLDDRLTLQAIDPLALRQCRSMLAWLTADDASRDAPQEFECVRQAHIGALLNRKLFLTRHGRLGVGSKSLEKGDCIWLVGGSTAPLILRHASAHTEPTGHARLNLVGHAYVHGIMQGEAVDPSRKLETFVLV